MTEICRQLVLLTGLLAFPLSFFCMFKVLSQIGEGGDLDLHRVRKWLFWLSVLVVSQLFLNSVRHSGAVDQIRQRLDALETDFGVALAVDIRRLREWGQWIMSDPNESNEPVHITPDELRAAIQTAEDALSTLRGSLPLGVGFAVQSAQRKLHSATLAVNVWVVEEQLASMSGVRFPDYSQQPTERRWLR